MQVNIAISAQGFVIKGNKKGFVCHMRYKAFSSYCAINEVIGLSDRQNLHFEE